MRSSSPTQRLQRLFAVLLLLPALIGLSGDLEIGHEHGLLLAPEGLAEDQLCLRDHERPPRASDDGLAPTAVPHRHDCAACQHSKTGRATLEAAARISVGPPQAEAPDLRCVADPKLALGHPTPRGPPIS